MLFAVSMRLKGRVMKEITPDDIAPPFARYAHGVEVPDGHRLIFTSGQLGLDADGNVPESVQAQADICFSNLDAILRAAGAERQHVVRLNAFVTHRAYMAGYMGARDAWLADLERLPASTLVIVSGFTRPEFRVEIEMIAAVPVER